MKTILLTIEYPPFKGGVASYYGNLAEHWSNPDDIFVLNPKPRKGIFKHFSYLFLLTKAIKSFKAQHIIVGQVLPLGTVVYLLNIFFRKDYSVVLHGLDFSLASKKGITRNILGSAFHIICANSRVAELVVDKYPNMEEKIVIVNPGVELCPQDIESQLELKKKHGLENKLVILTLGRLVKRKGVDTVISAWSRILAEYPMARYLIVGEGPDRKYLEDLARDKEGITFVGLADKWKYLNLCDIFVMPSRDISGDYEGFGIVYLEANSCFKPVIALNSGGVRDAVMDNQNGLLINSENELVPAILKLARDKELRDRLGKQGEERARNSFNWSKQALIIQKTIENI